MLLAVMQEPNSDLSTSAIMAILAVDIPLILLTAKRYPAIPLMMIFALAPFQKDMSIGAPVKFSIAEINLMVTCTVFLLQRRRILWGPAIVPIGIYFAVCIVSSLVTWRSSTLSSIIQMGLYIGVAVVVFTSFGRTEEDFRPALYGLIGIGLVLASAVIVTRSGYVFGLHKNGVGDSLAAAVIVCGELWFAAVRPKQRSILLGALIVLTAGLFFTLSRGAWMGALMGLIVILCMRRQFGLMFRFAVFLVPLVALCWHLLPDTDRSYTTGLTQDNWNIRMRYHSLYFARDRFLESPLIGVGVGLRKEYDATNLLWLILAETGVLGLIPFLAIHVSFLRMVWWTQKRLQRNELLYSVVALGGALIISKFMHGMVDHYWSRGAIMIAWAAAGMATRGYFVVQHRQQVAWANYVAESAVAAQAAGEPAALPA